MAEPDPSSTQADIGTSLGLMMMLGEIKGQLRELIHGTNNNSSKLDALGLRVSALEAEKSRRDGATSLVHMILKSPALGWMIGGAVTIWALLTGKVHA